MLILYDHLITLDLEVYRLLESCAQILLTTLLLDRKIVDVSPTCIPILSNPKSLIDSLFL